MSLRRLSLTVGAAAVSILLSVSVFASETAKELAVQAVSKDPAISGRAIEALRSRGYEGLDALLAENRDLIEAHLNGKADHVQWSLTANAIDKVARQKDAWASGLFWHTDLEAAKAEAARTSRPIVSLRLLGNLDEELSCANSRFFRSILYTDGRVAKAMREDFVLHWQSERPAPVMTVDFGDGRKLVTTVTGNSIHYVLSPDGRIIDALPGLYSPEFFAAYLGNFPRIIREAPFRGARPVEGHRNRVRNFFLSKWRGDLLALGVDPSEVPLIFSSVPVARGDSESPTALEAAPRAVTKMIVEGELLLPSPIQKEALQENTSNEHWNSLADKFGYKGINAESRKFIRRKYDPTGTKSDSSFEKLMDRLVDSVALDTVRNAYVFQSQILKWLNEGGDRDLEAFNKRVYSELFLTPASDPWLGLYSDDIFLGVEGNGTTAPEK